MSTTQDLYAFIDLPVNYTATSVSLNCYHKLSADSSSCIIYEGKLDSSSGVPKSPGLNNTVVMTGNIGAFTETINITDFAGTDTNYLCIKIDPASTFRFYGGKVLLTYTG